MTLAINTASKSIVGDAKEKSTWAKIAELVEEVPQGVHYLSGGNSMSQAFILLAAALGRCTAVPLNSRLTLNEREDIHNLFAQVQAPTGVFIATSGSQGRAKLVHLSPELLVRHASAVNEHLLVNQDDCWLACLPFFHVGGMAIVIRSALAGAGLKIIENSDADLVASSLDHKVTITSLVPTTLRRVAAIRKDQMPKNLRAIILGGGPIPRDLVERFPQVLPTYGLTESGSMVTCARPMCNEDERFTAGPALKHAKAQIINEDGATLPPGQMGTIAVKSAGAPIGYWRNVKETALTFREGWIITEDVGFLDQHGFLHVQGRRDRVVVSGGENIALEEIETAIRSVPRVRDALCLGLESSEWGQQVVAIIESDTDISLDGLREFLKSQLASFKLPKQIRIVARLPLLPNGKPDLQSARKLFG